MGDVAKRVRIYLDGQPSITECLETGLVNLSALSRAVAEELEVENVSAVQAACRRYPVSGAAAARIEKVRRLLRRSRIGSRTNVATVTLRPNFDAVRRAQRAIDELLERNRIIRMIHGSQGIVVILDDDSLPTLVKSVPAGSVIRTRKGLVEISVTSPESIEEIPGVMAYLTTRLAARGLNVLQVMSCFTDTIFIFEEWDLIPGFEALRECTR